MIFAPATAAYIHIPFCRRRCYYCDFAISVVGDRLRGSDSGMIREYIDLVCQEISLHHGPPLQTIFFGGGTPSLLDAPQLEQILDHLDRQFGIAAGAEISMEIDPGTFNLEQLRCYRNLGVNRVSLGVQAMQDHLLSACGRSHRHHDTLAAIESIDGAGITNWSLDLISGLPHQSLEDWQESLAIAIQLGPTHISTYDLTLEPITAFGKQHQPGQAPLPSEETTATMYRQAHATLESAEYQHYEISNYAQAGYQCRHNLVYWQMQSYWGFGMGAASYINGIRFSRPRTRQGYADWLALGAPITEPVSTPTDLYKETLMLGLRLAEGLELTKLATLFGPTQVQKLLHSLQPYQRQGWVQINDAGRVRLTAPDGFLFSNTVLAGVW